MEIFFQNYCKSVMQFTNKEKLCTNYQSLRIYEIAFIKLQIT